MGIFVANKNNLFCAPLLYSTAECMHRSRDDPTITEESSATRRKLAILSSSRYGSSELCVRDYSRGSSSGAMPQEHDRPP